MALGDFVLLYSGTGSYSEETSTGGPVSTVEPGYFHTLTIDESTVTGTYPVPGVTILDVIPDTKENWSVPMAITVYVTTVNHTTQTYSVEVKFNAPGGSSSGSSVNLYISGGITYTYLPVKCLGYEDANEVHDTYYGIKVLGEIVPADLVVGTYSFTASLVQPADTVEYMTGTGRYVSGLQPRKSPAPGTLPAFPGTMSALSAGAISLVNAHGLKTVDGVTAGALADTFSAQVFLREYSDRYTLSALLRDPAGLSGGAVNTYTVQKVEAVGVKYFGFVRPFSGGYAFILVRVDFVQLNALRYSYWSSAKYKYIKQYFFVGEAQNRVAPRQFADGVTIYRGFYLMNTSASSKHAVLVHTPVSGTLGSVYMFRDNALNYNEATGYGLVGDGTTSGVLSIPYPSAYYGGPVYYGAWYASSSSYLGEVPAGGCAGFWWGGEISTNSAQPTEIVSTAYFEYGERL